MSVLQALDIGLAFLVFAVAAWTIFARGAFAATVGYVVYGLLLSLVWIRLFAVDVALTEAAIGSGVTGVLLIGAAARLRGAETASNETSLSGLPRFSVADRNSQPPRPEAPRSGLEGRSRRRERRRELEHPSRREAIGRSEERPSIAGLWLRPQDEVVELGVARSATLGVTAALCLLVALALAGVVLLFPDQGPSLAPQSMQHLPETGLGNPVTAVLIAYRAFDTMLEKVVLVLAVVGVWSLAADRYWGGAPGEPRAERPEPTLAFLAQVLAPLGVLVGVHIFWVGADEPGGAFQGGAILAAMWIIVMMARLTAAPSTSAFWLRLALIAGPLVFLAAGAAGAIFAGGFFAYPPGFAKPVILFIEAFMVLSIAVTLPMLVAGPPRREPKVDGSR
jgi:multisubunit Na+/H+ antiporter MnhB subunit